jgi:4-amino-4-deoxy-L-arabinose transferase-like glycosyltransferase
MIRQFDERRDAARAADLTVEPLAWRPLLAIAGAAAIALLLTSGGVGYFGDELYFLAAGQHLTWEYADQGPLVPLLAHAMDTLFPWSLVGLRLPVTILSAVSVVAAALVARELGGRRRAQALTAGAHAMTTLTCGHTLNTASIDTLLWTVATWLLVRWVRLRDDRLLLALGGVTAVALQNKWLIVALWFAIGVSVACVGPRELLRRRALWLGAGIATLTTLPALIWQAGHGWPQLAVAAAIPNDGYLDYRLDFLPLVLATAGIPLGATLLCYGLWRLLRSRALRPYRFLGWTSVGLTVTFLATGGRHTYVAGLFAVCCAAGAVELQRHRPRRWWGWLVSRPAAVLSVVVALSWLPVLPMSWPTPAQPMSLMMTGLPEWTDTVAAAYRALPSETRRHAVIVTEWYWDAALIDRFGSERGLPPAYSADRGYWYFGAPPDNAGAVIFIDSDPVQLGRYFTNVRRLTTITSGGLSNVYPRPIPVWLCTGRTAPWARVWPQLQHF